MNILESIAATFAILTFTKEQSMIVVPVKIDNKKELSYLSEMLGTKHRELMHMSESI